MTKKQGRRSGRKNQRAKRGVPSSSTEANARTTENFAALSLVRAPKGPNNKYINTVYNAIQAYAVAATPILQCLNAVAQGTTENTRVGRLAKMKWVDLDLLAYCTTIAETSSYRIYVVAESTALGSALSPSQFFLDASTFTVTSQRDRTNRNASRYVVFWDSGPHTVGGATAASGQTAPVVYGAGQPNVRVHSRHINLGFSTDYSRGNAGTVADIDTNSLYVMIVTDQTTASTLGVVGGYTLCFNDDS